MPLQTIRQAAPDGGVESSGPEVWPLQGECVSQHALSSEGSSSDKAAESKPLRLSAPIPLLHRKGEFIRAVCVNALNGSQLAVSLSRGVQQLELVSELASSPYLDSPSVSERSASSSQPQSDWLSWGVGVKNAATRLTETSFGATGEPLTVLQSSGSDLTARCLCAHPKLPLYLAGGDSVVQCWQFGQTIQGRGLQDHVRAQYRLPSGGSVSSLRFSPCGEQFGSVDLGGSLCLWRFQNGADMPLPFSRLQCHSKRASDLCFVGSSIVLATVGASGSGAVRSLGLWDVLLPPSQALVAACDAHDDGGCCVIHWAEQASLVSGGMRGDISVFDLRQRRVRTRFNAHTLATRSLVFSDTGRHCFSASANGDMKLWDLSAQENTGHTAQWLRAHEPHTMLHPLAGTTLGRTYGINSMVKDDSVSSSVDPPRLLTAGADGKLNMWLYLAKDAVCPE
uniref:WD domain, G-beta repeat-containing protein n=1 Tax=Chrysotila carterae TaxID=13221 RepID=A0A7S4FD67_CHRCT